jgi:hypothetical protein
MYIEPLNMLSHISISRILGCCREQLYEGHCTSILLPVGYGGCFYINNPGYPRRGKKLVNSSSSSFFQHNKSTPTPGQSPHHFHTCYWWSRSSGECMPSLRPSSPPIDWRVCWSHLIRTASWKRQTTTLLIRTSSPFHSVDAPSCQWSCQNITIAVGNNTRKISFSLFQHPQVDCLCDWRREGSLDQCLLGTATSIIRC